MVAFSHISSGEIVDHIQAVTFDVSGTLLYPYPSVGEIYADISKKHGIQLNSKHIEQPLTDAYKRRRETRRPTISQESEKEWWSSQDTAQFDAFFSELWAAFAEASSWRLYDGVVPVLQELKARGYKLGILSNWDNRLMSILEGFDLIDYFDAFSISANVGFEKPDQRIFVAAEKALGISGSACLHVGDSEYFDHAGASNAGWSSLLIFHDPEKVIADHHISHFSELLEHLEQVQ